MWGIHRGAGGRVAWSPALGAPGDIYNLGEKTYVYGINNSGQIAGYIDVDPGWRAFLYTGTPGVDGQMINLDTWLDEVNPEEGAKWTLEEAYRINDAGLIVGYGWYDDGETSGPRTFLLDASALVPEPASLSLVLAGAMGLLRRRRR